MDIDMVNKWIYPLHKRLNAEEWDCLTQKIHQALSNWNKHGIPIEYKIRNFYNQVVVIEALSPVSGCAIDHLQKIIREVVHSLNLEIIENPNIPYLENNELKFFDFRDTQKEIESTKINLNTLILDIQKILEGEENPLSVLRETWLVRYC